MKPRRRSRYYWRSLPMAILFCAFGFLTTAWTSAHASGAAALVLECGGGIAPPVQPYSEIPEAARIKLDPEAILVFLDYESCLEVTVHGGEVDFGQDGYSVRGGRQSTERVPCPTRLMITNPGEVAGAHMRGGDDEPQSITTRPGFVLVGARADDFQSCKLLKNQQKIITVKVVNHHCELPPEARPLDSGVGYDLELVPKSFLSRPIKLDVMTSRPEGKVGKSLFLIQVD